MRLINVETLELEEFFGRPAPAYSILSHTWESDRDEVSFSEFKQRFVKGDTRPAKLVGCCAQTKNDGLKYAWVDTCCINKDSSTELSEAINSMFQWYANASICYAYLSDVPGTEGDVRAHSSVFAASRWFTRGWTLQELLAPREVRFYNAAWRILGTRSKLLMPLEEITGIPYPYMLGLTALREASIAQRLSWAAKRVTKRKEDMAYCLLGIFGITMPLIYGEGDQAFRRLQEEIAKRWSDDDSILAWAFRPVAPSSGANEEVDSNSPGQALAAAVSDFAACGDIVSRGQFFNSFEISSGRVRINLALRTASDGATYGLLHCGPEDNSDLVVAVPLVHTSSSGLPNEYVRPHGSSSILLPKAEPSHPPKLIYIQQEPKKEARTRVNRPSWFYIEDLSEADLELVDVEPSDSWQRDKSLIRTSGDLGGGDVSATEQILVRLRPGGAREYDFVLVLECKTSASWQVHAKCHLMLLSWTTSLRPPLQRYRPSEAVLGQQSATDGFINLSVVLERKSAAGQLMFVVRLVTMLGAPTATLDATMELELLSLKQTTLKERNRILYGHEDSGSQPPMSGNDAAERRQKELRKLIWEALPRLQYLHEIPRWLRPDAMMPLNMEDAYRSVLDVLFGDGAELAQKNDAQETPLVWAARIGNDVIVRLLIEKGAAVDEATAFGQTPLSSAAGSGHEAVVKVLLNHFADCSTRDQAGFTPLVEAVLRGHEPVARQLLRAGATVGVQSDGVWMPLIEVARKGQPAMVRLLLDKDLVDRERYDYVSNTLIYACGTGEVPLVKLLLDEGAAVHSRDWLGVTPLMRAAESGEEAVVRLLLDNHASVHDQDGVDETALHKAARNGNTAIVSILLRRGASVDQKGRYVQTPLSLAAGSGHEDAARLLLEKGADINSCDYKGWTVLMKAVYGEKEAVVRLLLGHGAAIDKKNDLGETALMQAVSREQETIVQLLLKEGAVIEERNDLGRTAIMQAADVGQEAFVRLLLKEGAAINAEDDHSWTALMLAAARGHEDIVSLLLREGAYIPMKYEWGEPLSLAAQKGHATIMIMKLRTCDAAPRDDEPDSESSQTGLKETFKKGLKAFIKLSGSHKPSQP